MASRLTGAHPRRSSEVSGDALAAIGTRLREARSERHITVREMARRVGVSASFISQIELGRAKPSVGTLYAIVSELDLSLSDLMTDDIGPVPPTVNPAMPAWASTSGPFPWSQPTTGIQPASAHSQIALPGVIWRRLTTFDDPMVDFLHVTYAPGGESCSVKSMMRHGGHEYGHVISGELEVQIGFEHYTLGPGDSIHFDSTTPHRLANLRDEDCTSIWFVVGRHVDPRTPSPHAPVAHLPELG